MKAWVMHKAGGKLYLVFGEDCVEAAKVLADKLGCNYEDFSVGKKWEVDPKEPLCLSSLWPHFTACPGQHSQNGY